METNLWTQFFCEMPTDSEYYGWVDSIQQVEATRHNFEKATKSAFSICSTTAPDFGNTDLSERPHFVRFHDAEFEHQTMPLLKYCGIPFIDLNKQTLECHRGFRHRRKIKDLDNFEKKRRNRSTKKVGCPAKIHIREVAFFPEFSIAHNTVQRKKTASKRLRKMLIDGSDVKIEKRFYMLLPQHSDHQNHAEEDTENQLYSIDKRVAKKIRALVLDGVISLSEMRTLLSQYVTAEKDNWFEDGKIPETRRYFPADDDIQNYVDLTRRCYDVSDQENLIKLIESWRIETNGESCFFRPCDRENDETGDNLTFAQSQSFLFVYQTANQRNLLARYGNEICYFDATYKTSKYLFPLHFVSVKTNVDYQSVCCFMTINQKTSSIYEALKIIHDWNPSWSPKCFVSNFSEEMISAVEQLFPNIPVYLCNIQREQIWQRWVKTKSHSVNDISNEILVHICKIAEASTISEFDEAVNDLKASDGWFQSPKLQNYFTCVWYPHCKRWVKAFYIDDLIVNICLKNGIESLNSDLKCSYLNKDEEATTTSLVKILRNEFFPSKFEKYFTENKPCTASCKGLKKDIPLFLQNKPRKMVVHCLRCLENSKTIGSVLPSGINTFLVSENDNTLHYEVFLGSNDKHPHCGCDDWKKFKWPCKHMFAVLGEIGNGWDGLPDTYKNSPFCTLDETLLPTEANEIELEFCPDPVEDQINFDSMVYVELPEPETTTMIIDVRTACRTLLNNIISDTYVLSENSCFQLYSKLKDVKNWCVADSDLFAANFERQSCDESTRKQHKRMRMSLNN